MSNYYEIHKTDISEPVIQVPKFTMNDSLDVTMVGRLRREYGEPIDESLLNLLENFACPGVTVNGVTTPDYAKVEGDKLTDPVIGQIWFNSTTKRIHHWDGAIWNVSENRGDYAANWGMIAHGEQLPKPKSSITGKIFEYDECIWSVSPAVFLGKPGYIACATDLDATVTMTYRYAGTSNMIEGYANYLIIGMAGNAETGLRPIPPLPSPTPTPTSSVTPTPTSSITPTPSNTPSSTPPPTPPNTPPGTPPPSASPTAPATPPPSASNTPRPTPPSTPPVTPPVTPSPTPPAGNYYWQIISSWSGQEVAPCRPDDMTSFEADQWIQQQPCSTGADLGTTVYVYWCDQQSPNIVGWYEAECKIGP